MTELEEEVRLVGMAKGGCRDAQTKLLARHEGLLYVIAVREKRQNRAADLDDLLQAARMGFLHALEKYDASLGYKYSTYAGWWVMAFVREESHKTRKIHIPEHILYTETDRVVRRMYSLNWKNDRTDKRVPEVVSPSADVLYEFDEKELLHLAISKLHPVYQRVLQGRFFDGFTLEELGREMGITKQWVLRLEEKALRQLRRLYEWGVSAGVPTEKVSVSRARLHSFFSEESRRRSRERYAEACRWCGSRNKKHARACARPRKKERI